MAVRLTVVVSQSSARDSHASDLEQSIVAEVMMTPGLDATMVGPLEHVQPDDTDYLCIGSFNHSIALVSWLAPKEVDLQWQRLGLEGEVIEVAGERRPAPTKACRIYHLRLSLGVSTTDILESLKQILADRSTKTVDIGMGSDTKRAQAESAVPKTNSASKPAGPSRRQTRSTETQSEGENEEDWSHLDRLVDDFESLDL